MIPTCRNKGWLKAWRGLRCWFKVERQNKSISTNFSANSSFVFRTKNLNPCAIFVLSSKTQLIGNSAFELKSSPNCFFSFNRFHLWTFTTFFNCVTHTLLFKWRRLVLCYSYYYYYCANLHVYCSYTSHNFSYQWPPMLITHIFLFFIFSLGLHATNYGLLWQQIKSLHFYCFDLWPE